VTVTQTSTEGTFVINTNNARTPGRLLFDVIDGAELIRGYAPKAVVVLHRRDQPDEHRRDRLPAHLRPAVDQTLGGNVKVWATALKS
jgi:hypothetical protein